jgi:putative oxidoreductase
MKSQRQLDERKEPLRDVPFQLLSRFPTARWAHIPLRLIVVYGFMEHGFAKLSRGSDAFATSCTR